MFTSAIMDPDVSLKPHARGKVRNSFKLPGKRLLMVATDRISAFDYVLPNGIPDKGKVLAGLTQFWLLRTPLANHWIDSDLSALGLPEAEQAALEGRSMIVRQCDPIPVECVVRGYLAGSGWKEYRKSGTVCGIELPSGLVESSQLPEPIFTPATKAPEGEHDENIDYDQMVDHLRDWMGSHRGAAKLAAELRDRSLELYRFGAEHAAKCGIIIADTKFEFGLTPDGDVMLIDEVLTPDSSRFWPADQYEPGRGQPSFDKQFVRDWLVESGWDRNSPPPELPPEIVAQTRDKYIEAYEKLVDSDFPWK